VETLLRAVKRVCNAGLDSISLRRQVSQLVAPRLAFDAYAFATCDPDTGLMTHSVTEGVPHELAKMYAEVLYPEQCARLNMDLPRAGRCVVSMIEHSTGFGAELRSHRLRDEVHVSIAGGARLWGTWCMMRDRAPRARSADYRGVLRRMVPHLARGLQSAALVERGMAASRQDTGDAPGVVILDARLRPLLRTPLAARWLADLADVGLRMPDDLPLAVVGLVARLRQSRIDVARTIQLRARGISGRLYSIRASLAEPDAGGECATTLVIQPAVPREVAAVLTNLYDLSAREREVAAGVARGESTKEIAASLGVSSYTVIEHIERACQKIGVRGRKALVAKLYFDGYAPLMARRSS
jgi:DNA-binding CsgD family transcriptional regulator